MQPATKKKYILDLSKMYKLLMAYVPSQNSNGKKKYKYNYFQITIYTFIHGIPYKTSQMFKLRVSMIIYCCFWDLQLSKL
jgi:hypothetical protein